MTAAWEMVVALALPFLGAVLLRLWPRELSARTAGMAATLVSFAALVMLLPAALEALHGAQATWTHAWIPTLDVTLALRVDGLSALFATLVAGIGVVVFAYAAGYMDEMPRIRPFFATLLAFQGAMLGVTLADDVLLLFLFWELTSLTSFLLIGYHRDDPDSAYSARKAMIVTVSAGVALFAGLLMLAGIAGTFRISEILAANPSGPLMPVAMGLVVAGSAGKAAQFPLHIWLPDAMVAPTPVSSYLHSAAMVKAGIYALARFRPAFFALPAWTVVVTGLGLTTMLITAILALGQRDPKKLLAYSTCSQLGLIVAALGIPDAQTGAVLHVAHHAVFKCGLFLVAGVAIHSFHAKTMDEMGGLAYVMPVTAAAALLLALASAGIPPLSAFVSKELVLEPLLEHPGLGEWLALVVFAVASMFTVAYSLRFFQGIFLGEPAGDVEIPTITTRAPAMLLGGLALLGGVLPGLWDGWTGGAAGAIATGVHEPHLALWHGLTPGLAVSAVIVGGGLVVLRGQDAIVGFVDAIKAGQAKATANHLYHRLLDACEDSAFVVGRFVQRETPQAYIAYTLTGAALLALLGLFLAGVDLPTPRIALSLPTVLVVGLAVIAALVLTQVRDYTKGLIALGTVGLMIGLFYLLVGAPDVGLTQLLVETLLLILFVAVVARLPPSYVEPRRLPIRVRDAAASILVGGTVTLLLLLATENQVARVGRRYFHDLAEATGGHNAVNVVLVDFRALDTLGEIVVVAIAGLAALTLAQGRVRRWFR